MSAYKSSLFIGAPLTRMLAFITETSLCYLYTNKSQQCYYLITN